MEGISHLESCTGEYVLFDLLVFGLGIVQAQCVVGPNEVLAVQARLLLRVILIILLFIVRLEFEGHEVAEVV